MKWTTTAIGKKVLAGIDWAADGYLGHTDPYLVWLDVAGFRGVALPTKGFLPVIEQRLGLPPFRTDARTIDQLRAFVKEFKTGNSQVTRFEVAPGVINQEVGARVDSALPLLADAAKRRHAASPRPVVGFIDFGCAFAHRQFRSDPGDPRSTRVLAIWDQGWAPRAHALPAGLKPLRWRLPPGFYYGAETHRDAQWPTDSPQASDALMLRDYIMQFDHGGQLDEQACYRHAQYEPVANRRATHGTHITDIATGWPSPLRGLPGTGTSEVGGPHHADIVFVQLPRVLGGRQVAGLLRANVYDALRYIETCTAPDQPIVVNLSYGGYAGPHDGSSVLEEAIDSFLKYRRQTHPHFEVVIAAGNARQRRLHAREKNGKSNRVVFHWHNLPGDPSDSFVEVWLPGSDGVRVTVTTPNGQRSVATAMAGAATLLGGPADDTALAALVFAERVCQTRRPAVGGKPATMVLLAVNPTQLGSGRPAAPYGCWTIEVDMPHGARSDAELVHAWCELDAPPLGTGGQPRQAYFTETETTCVDDNGTLNAIAHGRETIVVGGHAIHGPVAAYSGTGPGRGLPPRTRHAADTGSPPPLRGPQELAPSDENAAVSGIAAAALIGTDTFRMDGTSVAAAIKTRRILDSWRVPPVPATAGRVPSRSVEGPARAHPDSDLLPP